MSTTGPWYTDSDDVPDRSDVSELALLQPLLVDVQEQLHTLEPRMTLVEDAIRTARSSGASLAAIADACGLDDSTVHRVVDGGRIWLSS